MTTAPAPERWLIYVADPMCSWCWGFAPVIQEVAREYGSRLPLAVVVGGLAPEATGPMGELDRANVRHHWEDVRRLTGQSFDFEFFNREAFVYVTEPACRAVVAAQSLRPGLALDFLQMLQRAFYTANRDITQSEVLADVAALAGLDRHAFLDALEAPAARAATCKAFGLVRQMGVTGFPTLFGQNGRDMTMLASGYRDWVSMRAEIDGWLGDAARNGQD